MEEHFLRKDRVPPEETASNLWKDLLAKNSFYPAGNWMFKVNNKTLEQGVKYVQSKQ